MSLSSVCVLAIAVLVKTGMAPGKNPLVSVPIDLEGSVAVYDAHGKRVPSAVRTDPSGRRFVAWRIRDAKMLELMDYRIEPSNSPSPSPEDIPTILPGMNLIANADWSKRDENGDIADWSPSSRGYGIKDKWSDESRRDIRAKNGILGLRGKSACIVTYVRGLEAGHVYCLSFDGLSKCERLGGTIWYQGVNGKLPNDYIPNVGNYKTSVGVSGTGQWEHIEDASFVWYDERAKRMNMNCRGALPGTGSGYFYFCVDNGEGAVKNLRLEDVTSDSGVKAEIVK